MPGTFVGGERALALHEKIASYPPIRFDSPVMKTFVSIQHRRPHSGGSEYRVISLWKEREDGVPVGEGLNVLTSDNLPAALDIMGCIEIDEAMSRVDAMGERAAGQVIDITDCCTKREAGAPA